MRVLQIGQPFPDWEMWLPHDVTHYNYMQGIPHEILIMLHRPSPVEVEGIWQGDAAFGLNVQGPVVFLCFKFGRPKVFEGEAPYSIHIVPEEARQLPDLNLHPDEGAACAVILVDAATKLVKGLRMLAFTHSFSIALHQAIHDQYRQPFDREAYDREIARVYQTYTSKDMWRMCSHRCKAGEKDPQPTGPLFELGQVVATPGAIDALDKTGQTAGEFLSRHIVGDWGELDPFDVEQNDRAVTGGSRILSAYRLANNTQIWVITEWDRSLTTLLLPSEY